MSYKFEVYRLAGLARQKLLYHASQNDHDLRCLVLHANLLDTLLIELNVETDASTFTDRDTLPSLVTYHSNLHRNREPVIIVTEANEDATSDDDENSDDEGLHIPIARSSSPPMLSHDTDTESDSDYSDTEEGSSDIEVQTEPSSPTTSISPNKSQGVEPKSENDSLSLHRTYSTWSFNAA